MSSLNKVMIIGRLGRDPEMRYTQAGKPVCSLNVATDEGYTNDRGEKVDKTEWHKVVFWDRQGFPDWYVLERTADGAPITKTAQVRGIGNSVCPPIAAALASANYSPQEYPVPEFDMPLLAICEN